MEHLSHEWNTDDLYFYLLDHGKDNLLKESATKVADKRIQLLFIYSCCFFSYYAEFE